MALRGSISYFVQVLDPIASTPSWLIQPPNTSLAPRSPPSSLFAQNGQNRPSTFPPHLDSFRHHNIRWSVKGTIGPEGLTLHQSSPPISLVWDRILSCRKGPSVATPLYQLHLSSSSGICPLPCTFSRNYFLPGNANPTRRLLKEGTSRQQRWSQGGTLLQRH